MEKFPLKLFVQFFVFFCLNSLLSFSDETYWGMPRNLSNLNSNKDDFAPIWNPYEQRLFFSSNRNGISKFYVSTFKDLTNFADPVELPDPINRTKGNVSYLSFLSETEAFLNAFRRGVRQSYLNIFYVQRRANKWQKPVPLDSLQCECFVLHPTVSRNGDYMIFSSNMNNSSNLDLFTAFLQIDGSWGGITPLVELNTDGNEITPFLVGDDTLYFSSDGYGGPGGYDIFFSVKTETGWGKPIPLSQINSRYNESDFSVINDRLAVFSSDRPDGSLGGLDLFLAERLKVQLPEVIPNPELTISSQVSSIRIQEELRYSIFEPPTLLLEKDLDRILPPKAKFDENTLPTDIDSIKANFLNIYFSRAINEKLPITIAFDTTNSDFAKKIGSYLAEFAKIDPAITSLINLEHIDKKQLQVSSSNSKVFKYLRIGKKEFAFEPPQLEITLRAEFKEIVKNWNFEIPALNFASSGVELPASFSVNLNETAFGKNIVGDTLLLNFIASDTLGRKFEKSFPILLNFSFRAIEEETFIGSHRYSPVYLIADTNALFTRIGFESWLDQTLSNYAYIRSIIVLQTESWQTALLGEITKKLKEKTKSSQIEIRTEKAESQAFYKSFLRRGFLPILIEKR